MKGICYEKIDLCTFVMCNVLCSTAFAAEPTEEGQPILVDIPDDAEIPESTHSPMLFDLKTTLQSYTFSGLNNGYEYIWSGKTYHASDFPTKTLYYTTNLTTTGGGSTVNVGLATYSYNTGVFGVDASTVTRMGLRDSSYGWPKLDNSGSYRVCLQNKTGGVVRGNTTWYRVDRLS